MNDGHLCPNETEGSHCFISTDIDVTEEVTNSEPCDLTGEPKKFVTSRVINKWLLVCSNCGEQRIGTEQSALFEEAINKSE